jgi:hypothetical protein
MDGFKWFFGAAPNSRLAVLVAGLTLVAFVLPAEYAVDPLGTGKMFGLLELGVTGQQIEALAAASGSRSDAGRLTVQGQERAFQEETVAFNVGPREGIEYKYRLEKGEALLFSWNTTGRVDYEFHAEPEARRAARVRGDVRERTGRTASVGDVDGAVLGHPRLVLGNPRGPADDGDAQGRRLLQPVARISQERANQEQDIRLVIRRSGGGRTGCAPTG